MHVISSLLMIVRLWASLISVVVVAVDDDDDGDGVGDGDARW